MSSVLDAVDRDDVARLGLVDHDTLEPLEAQDLVDLRGERLHARHGRVAVQHRHRLTAAHTPAVDPPDADLADVAGVVQCRDLQLQRSVDVVGARRHLPQDRGEQRRHRQAFRGGVTRAVHAVLRQVFEPVERKAVDGRRVDHREVELLLARTQLVEEIEGLVDRPVGTRAGPVDLVDHDDRLQAQRQRLARHEAGLRHRSLDRVDQQQDAVDHRQRALDLAAEVGVPRGVDDVDPRPFVLDRAVLREDRDAALALEVVAVHDALAHLLVRAERAGLAQELVDQRGLAMIDVRDDGDVTNR